MCNYSNYQQKGHSTLHLTVRGKNGFYLAFGFGFLSASILFIILSLLSSNDDCSNSQSVHHNNNPTLIYPPNSQSKSIENPQPQQNQFRLFSSQNSLKHSNNPNNDKINPNIQSAENNQIPRHHRQLQQPFPSNELTVNITDDIDSIPHISNINNIGDEFPSTANKESLSHRYRNDSYANIGANIRTGQVNIDNLDMFESFRVESVDHKIFTNSFHLPQTFTQFAQWYFEYELNQHPKYGVKDREIIAKAYAHARIWLKEPRRSGKLYMEHHIGTSSCMMNISNPIYSKLINSHIIAAAMLHSSYVFGDVPMEWWPIPSYDKLCQMRRYVADRVTEETEYWIWMYTTFPQGNFEQRSIDMLLPAIEKNWLTINQNITALMHICNEVDEHSYYEQLLGHNRLRNKKFMEETILLAKLFNENKFVYMLEEVFKNTNRIYNWEKPKYTNKNDNGYSRDIRTRAKGLYDAIVAEGVERHKKHESKWQRKVDSRPVSDVLKSFNEWNKTWKDIETMCCNYGGPCLIPTVNI